MSKSATAMLSASKFTTETLKGASSSFVQHRKLLVLHPTGASVEFDEFL